MKIELDYKANVQLKKTALIFITLVGSYFISYLLDPEFYLSRYSKLSFSKLFIDFLLNLLFCFIIVEFSLFVDKKMNKFLPWTKYALRRLLVQTIIQVIFFFPLLLLFAIVLSQVIRAFNIDVAELSAKDINLWYYIMAIIFLMLGVSGVNTVNYLVANWKAAVLNAAEYKINAAESKQLVAETELQALRLQLDPHFVFNNLSVLSELILKDQQLGFEYTENFAKVYRYLLLNAKKKMISLQEELKFLDAYLFLLKNRIGSGVVFEIDVAVSKLDLKIPPVTLQLLVENALKYNRVEKENPLAVRIFTNETDELVVYNNLLPLMKNPRSSGIGLENIRSRFALLSDRKPQIEQNESSFTVKIPLLQ